MRFSIENSRFIQIADELIGGKTRIPMTKADFYQIANVIGVTPSVYEKPETPPEDEDDDGFTQAYSCENIVEVIPFFYGISLEAPWGGDQFVQSGYLLYSRITKEVYACDTARFAVYTPFSD